MKIKVITTFLLFCLIAGICYYISLPDYHVRNSMSFSNQGTRDTELTVIVYKYWGIDETIRKIETEHNKINGTPTTLEINYVESRFNKDIVSRIKNWYTFANGYTRTG